MYTIGRLNAAIYRNLQSIMASRLQSMTIKNGQYDFFYVISMYEGLSQKALSEHLHIGKSTTAKAVKDLIAKGYVEKKKDKQDGRVDRLYLTTKGQQMAPTVTAIFKENMAAAEKNLTSGEVETLLCLMEKVLNTLVEENARVSALCQEEENDDGTQQ